MYWRVSKANFERLDKEGRIWWGESGGNMPRLKRYISDVKQGIVPQTMWFYKDVGHTQEAKKELLELVDFETSDDVFITPKPTRLIQRILQIASDKDSLILDSFTGSGTTAHAVMKQNTEDGGSRRAILVEMDPKIARGITAERVRRVSNGYRNRKGEDVPGLDGGFRYCTLAQPLFDARGHINDSVRFADLAKHVYFVETGTPLPQTKRTTPLLGVHHGRAVYLLYNGILGDRSTGGGNTSGDRFYPDFVCLLQDGRILVVEYKGADRWTQPDEAEKRNMGAVWERRSGGRCLFVMPKGPDFGAIAAKVAAGAP
jgi:adenine-specific DNA-methyltransferase